MRLLGPTQVFVIQQARGRAREFSLLTNSQVVLKLPVRLALKHTTPKVSKKQCEVGDVRD